MANEKFTQLPTVASAQLADIICAVQAGISSQETLEQVFNLMLANVILHNAGNPNGAVAGEVYQFCWDTSNSILYICTTTGSSSTAVWTSAGSFSFPLSLANGGTGAALTASIGGLVYSGASALAILAGTATASQIPLSGANSAPTWSTAIYPATTTINQILYSSAGNVITGLATSTSATLTTNSSGVPAWTSSMTNGQILIGSTSATPVLANISAGSGISISSGAGSITISSTGSGTGWTEVTGTSQIMVADNGYIANNGSLVTLTLPTTAAFGTAINVMWKGAGGWKIAQNSGQSIRIGTSVSTVGVAGSIASSQAGDTIELICITADTLWESLSAPQGNITIV